MFVQCKRRIFVVDVSYGRGEPSYLGPGWKNVNYLKVSGSIVE